MLRVMVKKRLGDFDLDIAFEGASDGVTVLFGPSGSGKSSVLAAVAGALRPKSGRIVLNGKTLFDADAGIDTPMEQRRMGWVFQDARLFPHLSVEANLRFGLNRAPPADRPIRFEDVAAVLGVERLLGRRPRDLSGGERQRVGLGRALLSQPRLLLMDEPLASLDVARRAEILPFFETLKTRFGVPVLYVTHSLAEAVRLGDRMVVLSEGRVTGQGSLGQILLRPDLMPGIGLQTGAALDGYVTGQGERLTLVRAGGWDFQVPRLERAVADRVRLFVLARDVMLALEPPRRISARNVLEGRVAEITSDGDRVLVRVEHKAGGDLLSAVTPDAAADLGLRPGLPVWAVVKSVAIDGGLLEALES